jgi:FAD/FMN-containing dehydrogenase
MITGIEVPQGFPIVWAGDHGFEEARVGRVFNHRRPSRYPLAVVQARSVEEVIEGVQIAKKLGCKISVRSGGHSWAVWSVRDNAILLDLGKMNSMDLEESTGIVSVGPATTGTELIKFLEPKGRIFNGGHCPNVGLGGFLLILTKVLILGCKEVWDGCAEVGAGQLNLSWVLML